MTEPEPEPASTNQDEADRLARATRFGPALSILGISVWVVVIAAYVLLGVTDRAPGDPIHPIDVKSFLLTFILLAFGIFWGTFSAGLGFALSLLDLRRRSGPPGRARLGIGLGMLGVAPMGLAILEIARVSMR